MALSTSAWLAVFGPAAAGPEEPLLPEQAARTKDAVVTPATARMARRVSIERGSLCTENSFVLTRPIAGNRTGLHEIARKSQGQTPTDHMAERWECRKARAWWRN